MTTRHQISLPGGRTLAALTKPGQGVPVVFLHGLFGSASCWSDVIAALPQPAIAFDLPGFGASDLPLRPHVAAYADDLARGLDALGVDRFELVGHSFGGAVALELARRAEPGAIRRLMLYEPGVHVAGLIPAEQIDRIERLVGENRLEEALTAGTEQLAAAGLVRSDGPIAGRRPEFLALARTFPRELRAVDALGSDLSRYADVDFPTLLLVGGASPNRQQRNCAALARALPRVRVERLDGLGHVAHNAAPGRVADLTRAFLEAD